MSVVEQSASDFFGTLTGYDEIGVEKEFGAPVSGLAQNNQLMWLRSLIFVDIKRGKKDPDPKQAALRLTISEVAEYFAAETEDGSEPSDAAGEAPE